MTHALEVYHGERCVFWSDGRWLHPLFELERFVAAGGPPAASLEVRDKVVGRAAALVLLYLGVGSVQAGVLSRGGLEVLTRGGTPVTCGELVERIGCQTEDLLAEVEDPGQAWDLLRRRAGLAPRP